MSSSEDLEEKHQPFHDTEETGNWQGPKEVVALALQCGCGQGPPCESPSCQTWVGLTGTLNSPASDPFWLPTQELRPLVAGGLQRCCPSRDGKVNPAAKASLAQNWWGVK